MGLPEMHLFDVLKSEILPFYQAWKDAGAESTEDVCGRRKADLLAVEPPPLPADVERNIEEVLTAARLELS